MIFIDAFEIEATIDGAWKKSADSATEELLKAPNAAARKDVLKRKSDLWREIKPVLSKLSHEKCWYCETRDTRSDNAVDHFRPKGRVAEDRAHDGYWWLAFDCRNYRFSCTLCNSRRRDLQGGTEGGKQDRFPLAPGSPRITGPGMLLDLEQPLLLDPCCLADVVLLWFDETGQVQVNPNASKLDPLADLRVKESRDAYHLDHYQLKQQRRRTYLNVLSLCDEADAAYQDMMDGVASARRVYRKKVAELGRYLKESAEYVSVARCAIRGYRESSLTAKILCESVL